MRAATTSSLTGNQPMPASPRSPDRKVQHEHPVNLGPLPARWRASLVVSTYQPGKLTSGVEERLDLALLPGARSAAMRGPFSAADGQPAIWAACEPGRDVPNRRFFCSP